MIRIFIEPTDVLVFRTGLPFDAGADSYAPGIFPPSPEPLQGALREYLARGLAPGSAVQTIFNDEAYRSILGDRAMPGRFRMRGPFLARRTGPASNVVERLYPPPADLMLPGNNMARTPVLLRPIPPDEDPILTDWPGEQTFWRLAPSQTSDEKEQAFQNWLTAHELALWQTGDATQVATITGVPPNQLWKREPRIGIKIDPETRVVSEGFLYQMEFIRLQEGVGFDVDVWLEPAEPTLDLVALLREGWGRLGGEGRTVRYTLVDPAEPLKLPSGQRHKLYLATPAFLAEGWQPAGGAWSALIGAPSPVAAAIPRYDVIGGWSMRLDSQEGEHKPLQRHVSAGSIYYFNQPLDWDDQRRLTDDPRKRQIGYGVYYAGVW